MCPLRANMTIFNTFCGCDITRGKRWAVKNDKDYAESSTETETLSKSLNRMGG